MNKGINLAIDKKKTGNPLFNELRILRTAAMGILGLVAISSLTLFFLIAASPLPGLKKQENSALFQITQLHPKIAKYLLINERVGAIDSLLKSRDSKSNDLKMLETQIPYDTNVEAIKIDDKGINLSVSSTSLEALNTLIANILSETGTDKSFSSLLLNSLAYDSSIGGYHMSLNLTL